MIDKLNADRVISTEAQKFEKRMRDNLFANQISSLVIKAVPVGEDEVRTSYESENVRGVITKAVHDGFMPVIRDGMSTGKSQFLKSLESGDHPRDYISSVGKVIHDHVSAESAHRQNKLRVALENGEFDKEGVIYGKEIAKAFESTDFTNVAVGSQFRIELDALSYEEDDVAKEITTMVTDAINDVKEKTEVTREVIKEINDVKAKIKEEETAMKAEEEPVPETTEESLSRIMKDQFPMTAAAFHGKYENGELSVEALTPSFVKVLSYVDGIDDKLDRRMSVLARSIESDDVKTELEIFKGNVAKAKKIGMESFTTFQKSGLGVSGFNKTDTDTIQLAIKMRDYLSSSEEALESIISGIVEEKVQPVVTRDGILKYAFEAFMIKDFNKKTGSIDFNKAQGAIDLRRSEALEALYQDGLNESNKRLDEILVSLEGLSLMNVGDYYTPEYLTKELFKVNDNSELNVNIFTDMEKESARIKGIVVSILGKDVSAENMEIVDRLLKGEDVVNESDSNIYEKLVVKMGNKYVSEESELPNEVDVEKINITAKLFTTLVMSTEALGLTSKSDVADLNRFLIAS